MLGYAVRAKQKPKSKSKPKPRPRPAPAPQTRRPDFAGPRPAAPRPKPTKRQVEQARAQERTYGSPRVSDRMARDNRRTTVKSKPRRERQLMAARRRKYFPKNLVRATQRSRQGALQALADLRAQDPEKYARRQRGWLENAARDVGEYLKDRTSAASRPGYGPRDSGNRILGDAGSAADRALKSAAKFTNKQISERSEVTRRNLGLDVPVVDKLTKEAVELAANAPTGLYLTGEAGVAAAGGDFSKAKKLGKEFEKTSALVPLVKGDFKEAGRRAKERPLTTLLEASAAKALVGRGAGAGMRHAPSKRLRRIASTERAPQRLYLPEETAQRTAQHKMPVGGKRGPAANRQYSRDIFNKGLLVSGVKIAAAGRRDPNVDYGQRLFPGGAPWRRQLDREVDRQVFAAARSAQQRVQEAAKRANKATGREREQLLLAARADKIRAELRDTIRLTASKPKKRALKKLLTLSDRKLIALVEHGSAPRVKGRQTRSVPYSKPEQASAVKAIDRRARRGKPLGPQLTAALEEAGARHIARDVAARKGVTELPGLPTARGVLEANGIKMPPNPRRPSPSEPSPLIPEDFAPYFETARHTHSIAPRRVEGPKEWQELAALRAADEDILPTVVARTYNEAAKENAQLIANEFGIPVGKRGYVGKFDVAERAALRIRKDGGPDLVPLRVDEGKYMLVPRRVDKRFRAHRGVDRAPFLGPLESGNRLFKDVVLTTSSPSRWLGGNIADIGLRSLNEGLTPFDVARGVMTGRRMRAMGTEQARQSWANLTGGGLMGIADDLAQLSPVKGGRWNVPAHAWRKWKKTIYTLEHAIEKTAQAGMVGKQFRRENQRQINDMRGLLKLQEEALDRFARRLATSRAEEIRVARQVENLIGRWGKVSPKMRHTLSLAPFAQWLGASTRYVYVTLPVHHPIKTGILAGIMQMTEAERKRLGLSYFAEPADRAPDYQMGLLPTTVLNSRAEVRRYVQEEGLPPDELERLLAAVEHGPVVTGTRTSRMTSFGTAGNPGEWPGFALPQFAGAFDALTGTSFTGEPLEYPPYYPEKFRDIGLDIMDRIPVAAGQQLEVTVPFASAFRRIFLERGQPSEPFSTIMTPSVRRRYNYDTGQWIEPPGTWQQGLKRYASPVSPEGRIYTLGAQRDIDATQKAIRKTREWAVERARTPAHVNPYDPEAIPARKEEDQHTNPYAAKPKKRGGPPVDTHVNPYD